MDKERKHWRPRFSLRLLFVAVALIAAWMGWSVDWIRQRHDFLRRVPASPYTRQGESVRAPGLLWLFGEEGAKLVFLSVSAKDSDIAEGRRLFPEAGIIPPMRHEKGWYVP